MFRHAVMPGCVCRVPPAPHSLSYSEVVLLWLADYSRGERRGKEQKREEHGKRSTGRRGGSSRARQIQWRNPPSSQMNIAAWLPPFPPPPSPPPVSISVFSLLPSRFFSIIHQRAESPQLSAQASAAAGSPYCPARF